MSFWPEPGNFGGMDPGNIMPGIPARGIIPGTMGGITTPGGAPDGGLSLGFAEDATLAAGAG
eukprot:m.587691 g.587691  ORF g.587691 m.587691 type:complete len:62 (+) comp57985_c0_seq3:253-438(+)